MKISNYIRRAIAIIFTIVYLSIGLLTAQYDIYLQVFQSMSIPVGIILGAYFGNSMVSKYKNNGVNSELDD